MVESEIGLISHYFDKIRVAAIDITDGHLSIGDTLHIKGHSTDFTTTVDSMQIEHDKVDKAKKGDAVGIHVTERVREKDKVFKVTDS